MKKALLSLFISLLFLCFPASNLFAFTGVGFGGDANSKDLQLQLDIPITMSKNMGIDLIPFFSFRPFAKTVFEEEDGDYFQYSEYRFNIGSVLSKSFFFTDNAGLFVEGGGAYSIGKYSGVSVSEGNHHFVPVARAGFCFKKSLGITIIFKIGYEYLPIENVPANRGYATIMFGRF
ncbi:MAG: hypothetical protein PF637_09625 [Spirochaetes bacterium]|jgi:hypothetical protein|nr:hypothetical protein [Spirochaetota bacterium]